MDGACDTSQYPSPSTPFYPLQPIAGFKDMRHLGTNYYNCDKLSAAVSNSSISKEGL
jgi:hypothetical protein